MLFSFERDETAVMRSKDRGTTAHVFRHSSETKMKFTNTAVKTAAVALETETGKIQNIF